MIEEKKLIIEMIIFLAKILHYASAILFGLIGKVGMEMMMKRRYSVWQWIGMVLISVYFGYIAATLCEIKGWDEMAKWLPSFATLFGQQIALYLVYNGKRILDKIVDAIFRK